MGFLKRLLGLEKSIEGAKGKKETRKKSKASFKISNPYGHYDSSPLLVEKSPDLESIFNDPDPPAIQQLSPQNRDYWSTASVSDRRMMLFIGYLQHPTPQVRAAVMDFISQDVPIRVAQVLVDRLGGDPDAQVRLAAAKTIWKSERKVNCKYTVDMLNDEIRYSSEQSIVGPNRARKALQLLVDNAPDPKTKNAIQKLINRRTQPG